jgi:hypothetical protein
MIRTVYACDLCGAEQATTNHWFAAVLIDAPRRIFIGPLGSEDSILGENKRVFHLCGEACATKKVSEFLGAKD